jgi:small subunit ribosomal protein S20
MDPAEGCGRRFARRFLARGTGTLLGYAVARTNLEGRRLANIKQQKKRILRSEKQRESNIRYRSTIRTLFKGLESAEADDDAAVRAHDLEKLIDKAASKGAIHANNAARKKSRVARILAARQVAA